MPLPATCSIEALARWAPETMREFAKTLPVGGHSAVCVPWQAFGHLGEQIRALVEAKVREAVRFCSYDDETDAQVDATVARIVGAP